jgi:hypothetical protein
MAAMGWDPKWCSRHAAVALRLRRHLARRNDPPADPRRQHTQVSDYIWENSDDWKLVSDRLEEVVVRLPAEVDAAELNNAYVRQGRRASHRRLSALLNRTRCRSSRRRRS